MKSLRELCHLCILLCLWVAAVCCGETLENYYTVQPQSKDYCSGQPLQLNCPENQLVVMISATYGRMTQHSECVKQDLGFIGCSTEVLSVVDRYCSGRQQCNMNVPNDDLDSTQGVNSGKCLTEIRLYLAASYTCVPVTKPTFKRCHSQSVNIAVTSQPSIISSDVTKQTRCGGRQSPYILQASVGQTLNLSVVDFGWGEDRSPDCSGRYMYGYIKDLHDNTEVAICGGMARQRHLYSSKGHQVQLTLFTDTEPGFLITYQSVGCANLITPKNSWMTRDNENVVIGCQHKVSRQTWHLKCQGQSWVGVIGNCTQQIEAAKQAATKQQEVSSIPPVIAILFIIGIAIIISLVIIFIGLALLSRHKRRQGCNRRTPAIYQAGAEGKVYEEAKYKVDMPLYHTNPAADKCLNKRNEYTHIWEYPLPEPCISHESSPIIARSTAPTLPHNTTSLIGAVDQSRDSTEQYGGSIDSKTTDSLSRYYALDQTPNDVTVFHTSSAFT